MADTQGSSPLQLAGETYGTCAGELYALDDIARRFEDRSFSNFTMLHVIETLTASIAAKLERADELLSGGQVNEAHLHSAEAAEILNGIGQFADSVINSDGVLRIPDRVFSLALYELTVRAGMAIERAEVACGTSPSTEYLSGHRLDPCPPGTLGGARTAGVQVSR